LYHVEGHDANDPLVRTKSELVGPRAFQDQVTEIKGDLAERVPVVEHNREILAARRAWDAAQARPSQESAPPNPMISIGSVNAGLLPLPGKSIGMEPQPLCGEAFASQVAREVTVNSQIAKALNLKAD